MEDELEMYSWETDEGWIKIEKSLEFPVDYSLDKKKKFLTKKKTKYYKQHVNPDYTPVSSKTPTTEKPPEKAPEQPKAAPAPKTEPKAAPQPPTSSAKKTKLHVWIYVCLNMFTVCACFLTLIGKKQFYSYALYAHALVVGSFIFLKLGRPQFNSNYAQQAFTMEQSIHLLCAMALLCAKPAFPFLTPVFCRALNSGFGVASKLLLKHSPSLHSKVDFLMQPVLTRRTNFRELESLSEVYVGIAQALGIFFGLSSMMSCFVYWNFLRMKYTLQIQLRMQNRRWSTDITASFTKVRQKLDGYLVSVPFLQPYFKKLCDFMYSYADPVQMQQQYQQGQSSGGIMGNLASKCTIM